MSAIKSIRDNRLHLHRANIEFLAPRQSLVYSDTVLHASQ